MAALAAGLALLALFLNDGGSDDTRGAAPTQAARLPTVEADTDLFARCDASVATGNWAEAIRACRVLRARDPDYDGLTDKLVAAYLGRGQQRLAAGDDLAAAAADFQQALGYQPESGDAQQAWQRLHLYQQGDKALGVADWENAVAQLSAAYAEDPDYLQNLGARSLKGKLFSAWLAWGQSALNANAKPDAELRCSQALALVPDDPDARRCLEAAGVPD